MNYGSSSFCNTNVLRSFTESIYFAFTGQNIGYSATLFLSSILDDWKHFVVFSKNEFLTNFYNDEVGRGFEYLSAIYEMGLIGRFGIFDEIFQADRVFKTAMGKRGNQIQLQSTLFTVPGTARLIRLK